ncbi:esterase/lipase family protein [Streptomyces werraensis]|uniref:esterase/lipase family protein n=1 Tax=Streptomyces werraensis TaxID=68284 RepID=UPI00343BB93E
MTERRTVAVFIHGLFSDADGAWGVMRELLEKDEELSELRQLYFEYRSPWRRSRPYRRIPQYRDLASELATYLDSHVDRTRDDLILVTHSQGGLLAQRFLAEASRRGEADQLRHIKGVIMFACPTAGSAFGLKWRGVMRWLQLVRSPQERSLRPLDPEVKEAERTVVQNFAYANETTQVSCPMHFYVYAGSSDAIVQPASAHGPFRWAGTLPGGHSEIVRPSSHSDVRYVSLKKRLTELMTVQSPAQAEGVVQTASAPPAATPRPTVKHAITGHRLRQFIDSQATLSDGEWDETLAIIRKIADRLGRTTPESRQVVVELLKETPNLSGSDITRAGIHSPEIARRLGVAPEDVPSLAEELQRLQIVHIEWEPFEGPAPQLTLQDLPEFDGWTFWDDLRNFLQFFAVEPERMLVDHDFTVLDG